MTTDVCKHNVPNRNFTPCPFCETEKTMLKTTASVPVRWCLILQGISGSGKSTWITRFLKEVMRSVSRPNAPVGHYAVCSADNYFMQLVATDPARPLAREDRYVFEPAKLPAAHSACRKAFIEALQAGVELVVVDNTNTSVAEVAPYYEFATTYGYDTRIVRIEEYVDVAHARNRHEVPLAAIQGQAARLEAFQPMPWWTLHTGAPLPTEIYGEFLDAYENAVNAAEDARVEAELEAIYGKDKIAQLTVQWKASQLCENCGDADHTADTPCPCSCHD
jgi:predicted kinase